MRPANGKRSLAIFKGNNPVTFHSLNGIIRFAKIGHMHRFSLTKRKKLTTTSLLALSFLLLTLPSAAAQRRHASTPSDGPSAATVAPPLPTFAAPWLSFNTALSNNKGGPVALATGDLDGDGDLDVAAPRNIPGGGFVFLRNEGGGLFAAPVLYPGGSSAAGIVLADLDGDGDLDVAVTDSDTTAIGNTVSVYLNDGTGAFGPRQVLSVGSGASVPIGIVAADFDADGDQDLAVANFRATGSNPTVVVLFRNNGNGTFAAPVAFPAGPKPWGLATGDLNGDGKPDLVVAGQDYSVTVLMNNGAGGFAPGVTYSNLFNTFFAGNFYPAVALADVDRDGDLDVFYGNSATSDADGTTGHIIQLRNNGTGTLTRTADVVLTFRTGGPVGLVAADLNGDGAVDLIAGSLSARSNDGVQVVLNTGTGSFGAATLYPAGQATQAIAAADMNGDGKIDVLTADSYSAAVTVRFNPGSGLFPILTDYLASALQNFQDAADIDGDGDLDIFTSGVFSTAVDGAILRNDGAGHFFSRTIISLPEGVASGVLRDLNGDGRPDLLFNDANTAQEVDFFTALNNGDGTFAAPVRWILNAGSLAAVDAFDLDGDGDLDVVDLGGVGGAGSGFFIALNNGNGTFQPPTFYNQLPGGPERVVAGDFNHDGKLDLAMTDYGLDGFDSKVFIILGRGNGTFDPPIVYTVGRGPHYLVTADLDRDGNLDIATLSSGYNSDGQESVTVLFGTGSGTFTRLQTFYAPYSPDLLGARGMAAGDVDGDGDIDLMTTGVSNDVAIYLNDGTGTFSFPYRLGGIAGSHFPLFGDFTGDGIADIALLGDRPPFGFQESGVAVLRGLAAAPLTTASVVSRKTHGSAGAFAIDLPLSGTPGIECRSGNNPILVATFSNTLSSGNASVISGTGSVSSTTVSGNTLTVNLSGVTNRQTLTVTLTNVTDTFGQTLPPTDVRMNLLLGDVTANGSVNASDVGQVKANVGATLSQTNFRSDVTVNGSINGSDVGAVKAAVGGGAALPSTGR